MSIINNKKFRVIISLLLCIILIFNFSIKPEADALIFGGIALKVLATILASMGLLTFINSNSTVSSFANEWKEWSTLKGAPNVLLDLATIGVNSIKTHSKMKLSEKVTSIKAFWEIWKLKFEKEAPIVPPMTDVKFQMFGEILNTRFYNIWPTSNSGVNTIKREYVKNGTTYRMLVQAFRNTDTVEKLAMGISVYSNTTLIQTIMSDWVEYNTDNDFVNLRWGADINGKEVQFWGKLWSEGWNKSISFDFHKHWPNELIGFDEMPTIGQVVEDIPIPNVQSVPWEIAFPWQLAGNITGYIGGTIEDLIATLNGLDIQTWVNNILDIPKSIIDSIPVPEIIVDVEGVIVDVNVPDIDITIPEQIQQTGLLGSILEFLKSMFEIPKDVSLDFSPLQGLMLTDKFPFSLPWDLKNVITLLVAPPKPPRWEFPFVTETLVIDLSEFENIALISRSFSSLIFVVGMIMSTRKFVGGA